MSDEQTAAPEFPGFGEVKAMLGEILAGVQANTVGLTAVNERVDSVLTVHAQQTRQPLIDALAECDGVNLSHATLAKLDDDELKGMKAALVANSAHGVADYTAQGGGSLYSTVPNAGVELGWSD